MQFHLVTGFPSLFEGPLSESIVKRARERGLVEIHIHDLRDFTTDRHRTIDDYPYGGGPGMILKPEPIFACVESIRENHEAHDAKILYMSPQGKTFDQGIAHELLEDEKYIIICGHYKGIDERIIELLVDEEISIGDYVLTGGELPAMVIIDAVVRLIPGVLGDIDSAAGDSFQGNLLDHPHYTRPEVFRGHRVPEVLISGHHAKIEAWRQQMAESRTTERRADLIEQKTISSCKEEAK